MAVTYNPLEPLWTAKNDDQVRTAERLADMAATVEQRPFHPDDDRWSDDAACDSVEDPDLFHLPADPTGPAQVAQVLAAIAWCRQCPVIQQCRARRYDIGAVGSVWGGVYYGTATRGKRPCATAGCRQPAQGPQQPYCGFAHEHAAKVGTRAGYDLHLRAGVDACVACREGRYAAASATGNVTGARGPARRARGVRSGRRTAA